jgi:thiol-disulfide isomerase/thioredoxin
VENNGTGDFSQYNKLLNYLNAETMKKIFYPLCVCLLAVSCKQESGQFVLKGEGLSVTDNLYVYNVAENSSVDTVRLTGGSFTYTREITGEPALLLITDHATIMRYFVAEKGTLTLAGDTGFIKGSPLNDRIAGLTKAYRAAGEELEQKISALVESAEKEGQELTGEQILELENLDREQSAREAQVLKSFYEEDKNSVLGIFELILLQGLVPEEEFASLYEQGGEKVRNFAPFAKLFEAKANRNNAREGSPYADLQGVNPADTTQTVRLSDFAGKGKYTLLDFWASWCGPCKAAMPEIKRLNDTWSGKGLEVVGVVVSDEIENHLLAAKDLQVTWPQIFDSNSEAIHLYGIEGIPTLILLDKDGTILLRTHDKKEVIDKLQSLLAK